MSSAMPPPEALLLDYAAGTASPALGLLVATHLSMSKESRGLFSMMEAVGGALLDRLDGEPLERISATTTLMTADAEENGREDVFTPGLLPGASAGSPSSLARGAPATFRKDDLPPPLCSLEIADTGAQCWRRLGFGVAAAKLSVSSEQERAHLLWAKPGTGIATHRHVGREVVLVLKGAFWDGDARFAAGDIAISEDGTIHTPRIDDGEDCLCLAVTEAPVHFTGIAGWALNHFCRF